MPSLNAKSSFTAVAASFTPFWFFLLLFKFGAGIHYSLIAILGGRILPLPVVGLFIGISVFIQLALDVPSGFMLERYGYLRMLRVSTICFFLAGVVLIFGLSPLTFILSIIFSSLGWLFFTPGIGAYLLAHSPVTVIGRMTGLQRTMQAIGMTMAVIGLPYFSQLSGSVIGLLVTYPFVGAFIVLTLAERRPIPTFLPARHRERRHLAATSFATLRQIFQELHPLSTIFLIYSIVLAAAYGLLWFTLPLLIATNDSGPTISLGLIAFDTTTIVSALIIGRLVDASNKKILAYLALAIISFAALFLWSTFQPLFIVLCFLFSFGDEIFTISLWSWLDARLPRGERYGLITGALTFAEDLGWMAGPIIAGLLYTLVGPINTLRYAGLAVVFCAIIIGLLLIKARTSTAPAKN
ncbi:TPA: hypothetical protein DEP96_02270 [Candidatus Uhrbacteria bacterium]|nr:hypothetical protein [Candidatus Uhrbacteria bacterium]